MAGEDRRKKILQLLKGQILNGSQLAKFFTEHNLIAVLGSIVNEIDFLREFLEEKFSADGGETAKICLKSLFFR